MIRHRKDVIDQQPFYDDSNSNIKISGDIPQASSSSSLLSSTLPQDDREKRREWFHYSSPVAPILMRCFRYISNGHTHKKQIWGAVLLLVSGYLFLFSWGEVPTITITKIKNNLTQRQQPTAKSITTKDTQTKHLGTILFLAPARKAGSMWGMDRFCLLLRAVRSVDQHLNSKYGPYPIYILVAQDYQTYVEQQEQYIHHKTFMEGPYTTQDLQLLRQWAPNTTTLEFIPINMYTQDALEPNTTVEQIFRWRQGKDGGIDGRPLGYCSMCRLWSGRLQQMNFLDHFEYYMRMDDDSLLLENLPFDPFQRMKDRNLSYVYRRTSYEQWGVKQLWNVSEPFLPNQEELTALESETPFVSAMAGDGDGDDEHSIVKHFGRVPYNNFHIAPVSFWRSPKWLPLWETLNQHHLFYKYRLGDANVHAIATLLMNQTLVEEWEQFPYAHNSNDYGKRWGTKAWGEECQKAYSEYLDN